MLGVTQVKSNLFSSCFNSASYSSFDNPGMGEPGNAGAPYDDDDADGVFAITSTGRMVSWMYFERNLMLNSHRCFLAYSNIDVHKSGFCWRKGGKFSFLFACTQNFQFTRKSLYHSVTVREFFA